MDNLLLRNKYRPKSINDMVLLPRIISELSSGVKDDYIFLGEPGCGKTTMCKIIAKLYSSITIKETSVEVLRGKITEFCNYVDMGIDERPVDKRIEISGFDIDIKSHNPDNIKVVFLDEFDDISKTFMEGLKTFMEDNEHVRFIATSNNVSSVLKALKSRFTTLDFNAQNTNEENYLKQTFAKRIKADILPKENFEMSNEEIVKLVSKSFPDFRAVLKMLQHSIHNGDTDISGVTNIDIKTQEKLYAHIFDKTEPGDLYHFIMDTFGADRIEDMIKLLGRPFFNWILINKKDWLPKTRAVSGLVVKYSDMLPNTLDPFLLGFSLVCELQCV